MKERKGVRYGPLFYVVSFLTENSFLLLKSASLFNKHNPMKSILSVYNDTSAYDLRVGVYGASAVIYFIEVIDGGVAKRNRFVVE